MVDIARSLRFPFLHQAFYRYALFSATTTSFSRAMTSSSTSGQMRSVAATHNTELVQMRPGFVTRGLRAGSDLPADLMDPFVNLDNFWMDQPTFPPHPHAGFSAVTYMMPDSEGSFNNRWSKGEPSVIGPGCIHWTQAGSGMIHEEVPTVRGTVCHGIQMFVKLPSSVELSPPVVFHNDHPPEVLLEDGKSKLRILAGTFQDRSALLDLGNSGLQYWEVNLAPGGTVTIPAPKDQSAFVFMLQGAVKTADGTLIDSECGAAFAKDGDVVQLTAVADSPSDGNAQFMYCSGTPNREPIKSSGPFMMSSKERLAQTQVDYRDGKMGTLDPSF